MPNPSKLFVRDYKDLMIEGCQYFNTREDFKKYWLGKIYNTDPPPYDPTKRVKKWTYSPLGLAGMRFSAMVLMREPDSGLVIPDNLGYPFLVQYLFSVGAAQECNIPNYTTNEEMILPEAWIPLRQLEETESLCFRDQLPPEAGLLTLFSSFDAYLLDSRYKPAPVVHTEDLAATLQRMEKKIDTLLMKQ